MKNIKYFLTLGIVLVSSAIVLTGCGGKDSKEETTTINISGESTDRKCADEIAAQIQNCISEYENTESSLIPAGGDDIIFEWESDDIADNNIENKRFKELIKEHFNGEIPESRVKKDSFPKVTISFDSKKGYNITVELGNATITR